MRGYKSTDGMKNGIGLTRWLYSGEDEHDLAKEMADEPWLRTSRNGSLESAHRPRNGYDLARELRLLQKGYKI